LPTWGKRKAARTIPASSFFLLNVGAPERQSSLIYGEQILQTKSRASDAKRVRHLVAEECTFVNKYCNAPAQKIQRTLFRAAEFSLVIYLTRAAFIWAAPEDF
jgi:hypothetical protein